ncbi:MAG: ABC transporter permease [Spirosoma sp.]|nr:ABC transporter permease [Spirosoma sp.]
MLTNYLKIALRQLWRNRLYSLINISGLALGVACCLLISLYVYGEWNYDRFYPQVSNVYRVIMHQPKPNGQADTPITPGPLGPTLKTDFPEVQEAGRVGRWNGVIRYGSHTFEEENMSFADNGLLQLFKFPVLRGNVATALTHANELVMTETTARKYFGPNWQRNPKVIGTMLRLNNERDYRVVAILKDVPSNSHLQFDILLSFKNVELDPSSYSWNWTSYHTYLRLRPDTDRAAFDHKLAGQYKRYVPESKMTLTLQSLTDIYLYSGFDTDWGKRGSIFYVRLFGLVGLIVLLIACINFINLATARASRRAREVGVRKTVGAHRHQLIFQFLGESFLLTGLSVSAALLLANALLTAFNQVTDTVLVLNLSDPLVWLVLSSLTILIGLLAGLYPAFLLSAYQPNRVLKGIVTVTGATFRQTLVVGQFVMSLVLIICSFLIYNQLKFMQHKNIGFDKSQLVYVRMGGELRKKSAQFKKELLKQSSIEAASTTTATLVDVANEADIEWEGQMGKADFFVTQMNIDPDFLQTVGMRLARGSNFRPKAVTDTNQTYLVNETAARRMGYTNRTAIGKRVTFWGKTGLITGVVRDFHFRPLNIPIQPFIFRYGPGDFYFQLLVKTQPGRTSEALQQISRLYGQYEKDTPLRYGFVNQELDAQYRAEQRTGQIVLCFAGLAILISCLGLLGLMTFSVEARTKEIGVRKVLGASVGNIVTLLSKDFLKLILLAVVIASPVAWWAMNRWLANFAYKINIEWWVFALAGGLVTGVALLTVSFQSIRAALMNPVKSLRNE